MALGWLFWWIVGVPASAAVPVVLPRGERADDWLEPLAMAGLEPGPPGDGQWIIVAETEGHWWLVVSTKEGAVVRTEVTPPASTAAREELAFLAASLLRTVAPPVQAAPLEETLVAPETVVVQRPPPNPTPTPTPTPTPVVESAPAVVDVFAPLPGPGRLAWLVHLGASGGLGAEAGVMTGASLAITAPARLRAGGHVDHSVDSALLGDSSRVDLSRWDFGGFLGIEGPQATTWCLGLAGSRRGMQTLDPDVEVHAVIPHARGQVVVPLKRSVGPTLALTGLAGLDLRATEVRQTAAPAEALPRWTAGLGVALTQRTRAPWEAP